MAHVSMSIIRAASLSMSGFSACCFTELGREFYRILRYYLRKWSIDSENLLIIGAGKVARDITSRIKGRRDLGYNLVGVVTPKRQSRANVAGVLSHRQL